MYGNSNDFLSDVKPGKSLDTSTTDMQSLNNKYSILPPLKNRELLHSPKPRTIDKNDSLSTSIVVPSSITTNGRYNSQPWTKREANKEIRESDRYIKYIIKQKKDEYKKNDSNFDLLVAKLVNDREKERNEKNRVKSPKKRSAGRSRTSPVETNTIGNRKLLESSNSDHRIKNSFEHGDENEIYDNNSDNPIQNSLSLDLQSFEKLEKKEDIDKTPKSERAIRERPKSARYGRRTSTARPKTGYGSRRVTKEDHQISNNDVGD